MKLKNLTRSLTNYEEPTIGINVNCTNYRISPEFESVAPTAFVGQAFGAGDEYNRTLAKSVKDALEYCDQQIPIFFPIEIGKFLDKETPNCHLFGKEILHSGSKVFSNINTHRSLKEISRKMDETLVSKESVLYFAHPAHVYRVQEQGKIFEMRGGVFIPEEITWSTHDPQKWVRNSKNWKRRELLGRLYLWTTGKIKQEL